MSVKSFHFDPEKTFPHLTKAPVVEAAIGWTAKMDPPVSPDNLASILSQELPDYPKQEQLRSLQIFAEFKAKETPKPTITSDNWQGIRIASSDGLHIAQFNPNEFIFSRLAPYNHWTAFSDEAKRLWGVYRRIGAPSEIQRLGVRYINRFGPVKKAQFSKLLQGMPKPLDKIGLPSMEFLCRTSHRLPEYDLQINVVQTVQPATTAEDDNQIIIDMDVFTTRSLSCEDTEISETLEKMRMLKNVVFFELLKPAAVKRFQ